MSTTLISSAEAPHMKNWLMKVLPEISETETDILADYVLALLTSQEEEHLARATCIDELPPFLNPDATEGFVNKLFDILKSKQYLPPALRPPPPKQPPQPKQQPKTAPLDPKNVQVPSSGMDQQPPNGRESKKRSYNQRGEAGGSDGQYQGERAFKQPRRGGPAGRGGKNGFHAQNGVPDNAALPPPFAPLGHFDPVEMKALFNLQPTEYDPTYQYSLVPPGNAPSGSRRQQQKKPKRCRDFDTKGFCARGNTCQFDHGSDMMYFPPETAGAMRGFQDMGSAEMAAAVTQNMLQMQRLWEQFSSERGRRGDGKKARGRGGRRGRGRAPISATGPVHDPLKSTIVVENIPPESQSEEAVREAFIQFGDIVDITLQPTNNLAVVKFDSWASANGAYNAPKAFFDNRFVRLFWYKDDAQPSSANADGDAKMGEPAEPEIDMEEFMKKQEEAQRVHEERMQKRKEIEDQRKDLEQRQRELIRQQLEAKQKLHVKLNGSPEGDDSKGTSSSDALRAQLAALEEEALILGLDPHDDDGSSIYLDGSQSGGFRGRGRGRGRGSFVPRARGSFRGSFRGGRGGGANRGDFHAAYAAYTLDNRPRSVIVSGADFTKPEKDEALRQHLLGIGEFTDVETTPTSAQITFKDRKTAEKFFFGAKSNQVPGIEDSIEVSWAANTAQPSTIKDNINGNGNSNARTLDAEPGEIQNDGSHGGNDEDGDGGRGSGGHGHDKSGAQGENRKMDMDYELAEEGEWA